MCTIKDCKNSVFATADKQIFFTAVIYTVQDFKTSMFATAVKQIFFTAVIYTMQECKLCVCHCCPNTFDLKYKTIYNCT